MMVTLPTFADDFERSPFNRAGLGVSFGLKNTSGSSYKMWAKILNPAAENVSVSLKLYDSSYHPLASITTTSSDSIIYISKVLTLSSGSFHLRISYSGATVSQTLEKTYSI